METLAESVETVQERPAPVFRPAVTVALVVLSVAGGRLECVLLPGRDGCWRLPRQIPAPDQSLDAAARSELGRYVGGPDLYLEQLYTRADSDDGGMERMLEVAYLALAPPDQAAWSAAPDGAAWWSAAELPRVAPGHAELLKHAHTRLRRILADTNAAWSLLPAQFTLTDLQLVYEAVQGRALDKRNFRKWILASGMVQVTPDERRYGAHRPARLYRFTQRELQVLE